MNREENSLQFRAQMAQSAAPFMHVKLHALAVHQTAPPFLDADGNLHLTGTTEALPPPSVTTINIISVPSGEYIAEEPAAVVEIESVPSQNHHADETI
jgi:hypothetical protein